MGLLIYETIRPKDEDPQIIIDDNGIKTKEVGVVAWSSIREVWPEQYRGAYQIVLQLDIGQRVSIPAFGLEMLPGDIRMIIEQRAAPFLSDR